VVAGIVAVCLHPIIFWVNLLFSAFLLGWLLLRNDVAAFIEVALDIDFLLIRLLHIVKIFFIFEHVIRNRFAFVDPQQVVYVTAGDCRNFH